MQDLEDLKLVVIDNTENYEKFKPLIVNAAAYRLSEYLIIGAYDEKNNVPVGIIICSEDEADIAIDYIFVDKEYRRKGIATLLFEQLKELCVYNIDVDGLTAVFEGDNEELFAFFYVRPDIDLKEAVLSDEPYLEEKEGCLIARCNFRY